MRAKVLSTGETVDVINENISGTHVKCKTYKEADKEVWYKKDEIVFISDYIDWEQRRYELAKSAMQGLLNATSVERFTLRIKPDALAEAAIEYADAVIKKLREG